MTNRETLMISPASTVVDMVLRDHALLREDITTLKDGTLPGPEMRQLLLGFLRTLRAHTVAGEGALLEALEKFHPLNTPLHEILAEHDIAENLHEQIDDLLRQSQDWSEALHTKAKILAETVEHYILEEERLIEQGRTFLSAEELDQLRGPYALLRRSTLEKDDDRFKHFTFHQPSGESSLNSPRNGPLRPAWAAAMKEMRRGQSN